MYGCRFEKVVVDFIEIRDGPNDMRSHVSLPVERLHPAPDSAVAVLDQFGLLRIKRVHVVLICCFAIDPLFYLDDASSVVHLIGDIRGLRGYTANLAHEGDLRNVVAVDLEVCIWVRLVCIEGLFHCDRPDGVLAVGLKVAMSAEDYMFTGTPFQVSPFDLRDYFEVHH